MISRVYRQAVFGNSALIQELPELEGIYMLLFRFVLILFLSFSLLPISQARAAGESQEDQHEHGHEHDDIEHVIVPSDYNNSGGSLCGLRGFYK